MTDDLDFTGQAIVVTGAASGIGAAVAANFRKRGATVYCFDRSRCLASDIRCLDVDVTDPAAVETGIAEVVKATGRLDAVVACAGITRDRVIWKLADEDWSAVLRVNLDGAFHLVRAAVSRFRERDGGSIVLISSINGERGKMGQANYAASKAGLIGMAKSAARELGRFRIRVNVVAPGFIDTPLTQDSPAVVRENAVRESALGHVGHPDDVAHAVLFLCSGLASHITGQVLRVDGGQYM